MFTAEDLVKIEVHVALPKHIFRKYCYSTDDQTKASDLG
jgi:hypothetical protein